MNIIDDSEIRNDINENIEDEIMTSYTYMTKKNKGHKKRWTKEEDELFFESLRCCGCEFSMMNMLFPDRTRNNLKEKFKRELKLNNTKVENALNNSNNYDFDNLMELRNNFLNKKK